MALNSPFASLQAAGRGMTRGMQRRPVAGTPGGRTPWGGTYTGGYGADDRLNQPFPLANPAPYQQNPQSPVERNPLPLGPHEKNIWGQDPMTGERRILSTEIHPGYAGYGQPPEEPESDNFSDLDRLWQMWASKIGGSAMPPGREAYENIDDSAAVRAAYGRGKEAAGHQSRQAMNALQEMQGARGIGGSPLSVAEAASRVIGPALNQLGDVNREIMIQQVENQRRRASEDYAGRVGQRGQDIGLQEAELARRHQALLQLISMFRRQRGGTTARY